LKDKELEGWKREVLRQCVRNALVLKGSSEFEEYFSTKHLYVYILRKSRNSPVVRFRIF
jgi:hypothetical protein